MAMTATTRLILTMMIKTQPCQRRAKKTVYILRKVSKEVGSLALPHVRAPRAEVECQSLVFGGQYWCF